MDDAQRADLLSEVAERHRMTCWEVYQMVRLVVFGPEAVDNPVYDPIEELELQYSRDCKRLEERPSILEALAIWQRAHDVCVALAERQRDPAKRAVWFAQLAEREAEMAALRERMGPVVPAPGEMSADAAVRLRAFRANVKRYAKAGGAN